MSPPAALTAGQLSVFDAARVAMQARLKVDCSACRYCQPCPQGVEIPELLARTRCSVPVETKDPWLTGLRG